MKTVTQRPFFITSMSSCTIKMYQITAGWNNESNSKSSHEYRKWITSLETVSLIVTIMVQCHPIQIRDVVNDQKKRMSQILLIIPSNYSLQYEETGHIH